MVDLYMRHNIRTNEEFEFVTCPLCGFEEYEIFLDMGKFRYVKCKHCGLVYQNPQPVENNIFNRYDNIYFNYELLNHKNFFKLQLLTLDDINFKDKFLPADGKRFLDVGSATGLLLNYMKNLGFRTYGVEVCRDSVEYARKKFGLNIFQGTLEEANFPDNFFDIIHFSHLIEHLKHPMRFMYEVKRILKDSGDIFLTTPRLDSPGFKLYKKNWRSAIPDHLQLFTRDTLFLLLKSAGFEVIFYESWGFIPIDKKFPLFKGLVNKMIKKYNKGDVIFVHAKKKRLFI